MKTQTMEVFESSGLYLSAFLKARGLRLVDHHKAGGNKLMFVFEDRSDRQELVQDFYNNGTVDASAFVNSVQSLKTLIFNG